MTEKYLKHLVEYEVIHKKLYKNFKELELYQSSNCAYI